MRAVGETTWVVEDEEEADLMSASVAGVLDSNVLLLNRNYLAIRVITVRRAFLLLFKNAAEVIHFDDDQMSPYDFQSWVELSQLRDEFPPDEHDEFVRTVSVNIRVPRIVRLLFYDRLPRRTIKFNRRNIFARDGNRCQYCGRRFAVSELSLDHIVPRHRGGQATWQNIVCACMSCNVKKGGRLPEEAGMNLVRKPVKPRRSPLVRLRLHSERYRSWRYFVDEAYWNVELH